MSAHSPLTLTMPILKQIGGSLFTAGDKLSDPSSAAVQHTERSLFLRVKECMLILHVPLLVELQTHRRL